MIRPSLLLGLMCLVPLASAQKVARVADLNLNSWWVYTADHPINKRWGLIEEAQVRRSGFVSSWQNLHLQEGIRYKLNDRAQVSLSYVSTRIARYGDFPNPRPIWIHALSAEAKVKLPNLGKVSFEERMRLEERWLGQDIGNVHSYRYQERFRSQFKASLPISSKKYVFAYTEPFFSFGANHGVRSFEQIRAGGGLGLKVTENNRLELGYLLQYILQRNNRVEEYNHTLRVQWVSSTPLTKILRH